MANKTGKGGWKKGQSGNPAGGKPVLMPEVRALAHEQRNTVKVMLAMLLRYSDQEFEEHSRKNLPKTQRLLVKCIERIENDGDVDGLRKLLEILVGKIVEEAPEETYSDDEKALVAEYRRRKELVGKIDAT